MQTNKLNLPLLQDADLKGKVVLVRVDHNVVKKGTIVDPYRIDATIGTIHYIAAKGGRIILMTHVGRPFDKKTGEIKISSGSSVDAIVEYLYNKLQIKFTVPELQADGKNGYTSIPESVHKLVNDLREYKIDAIYLPNTRWFNGEESKGDAKDVFGKQLAGLADIYVNDAFGSWQSHASTYTVAKYMPSYAGFLMQKELNNLERIFNPEAPFVAVVAGVKFDTKIDSLYALIKQSDYLILGGVIYYAYLSAKYGFKMMDVSDEDLEAAKKFVEFSKQYPGKILELSHIVESNISDGQIEEQTDKLNGNYKTYNIRDVKPDHRFNYMVGIAKESFNDEAVRAAIMKAKTIFVNAVMGFAPYFNEGTIALYELIDKNNDAMKLYGGGDTLQEMRRLVPGLYMKALEHPKYYAFTGGGAVLKAIEEGTTLGLGPVKALVESK